MLRAFRAFDSIAVDKRAWYFGNTQDNVIDAKGPNNIATTYEGALFDGGTGADTLIGGRENTWYVVDNLGDVVIETAPLQVSYDVITSSAISLVAVENVEVLELRGELPLSATGDARDDDLRGSKNSGANVLTGMAGNDTYLVGPGDMVVEASAGGIDMVVIDMAPAGDPSLWPTGRTFRLGDYFNVENIAANGYSSGGPDYVGLHLIGTAGMNVVLGSFHDDVLEGGDGDDVLEDRYKAIDLTAYGYTYYGADTDQLFGDDGNDHLIGWLGNDLLSGGAGNDLLDGGSGDDTLDSGPGNDVIVFGRGDGHDTFREVLADSAPDKLNVLRLDAGVAPADVTVSRWGSNLGVSINGTSDWLTVQAFYLGESATHANNPLQRIEFSDGTVWDLLKILELAALLTNHAPTVSEALSDQAVDFESSFAFAIPLTSFADADTGEVLSYTATLADGSPLPTWMSFNTSTLTFDGSAGSVGTSSIKVTATDRAGASVSDVFDLVIAIRDLVLTGTDGPDVLFGGPGNDTLNGMADADYLAGKEGNDRLDGGTGDDTLRGGTGDDTYVVDSAGDSVTENASEGVDTVQTGITYTLGTNVENLTLIGDTAINATGNSLANTLTGNSAANVLEGGTGADTMAGGAGNDSYAVDNAGDIVTELAAGGTDSVNAKVSYTLGAEVENLTLLGTTAINATGNALANTLTGNSAANVLNGGAGADTLIGGAGNDTYLVDDAGDVVTEAASAGTDVVQASISYTLGVNLENLTLVGAAALNATGNSVANVLTGNAGDNLLTGGAGNDTMIGGAGDDTYVLDVATDVVTEAASAGTDTVQIGVTYTLGANVENLSLTGTTAVNGTGNTLANRLTGNSAANTLSGAAGADTMLGGAGNDIYVVDNVGDVVTESAAEGTDLVQASVTYTLGANVENLTLTGTSALNATGNGSANTLTGNSGANGLDGGAGADTLVGGAGNDTYTVDNAADVTTEAASAGTDTVLASLNWTLATNLENLTLTGTANLNATGNSVANVLTGNAGDNLLTGGAGNDTLVGGAGNDSYVLDVATDVVTEALNAGTDTVQVGVTYTLGANVENLTLTGSSAIKATGNALANVLTGNSGVNVMTGGAGNDTYVVGTGDSAVELAGGGSDTVQTSITWTLGTELENLTLTGSSAINGTGNTLANVLNGNSGNNTLTGAAGNDTLDGGAGVDILVGGTGNDTFRLGRGYGTDTLQENDATAGNTDVLQFLSGVAIEQVWFRHVGNNLEVSIIGTSDKMTLTNWYSGANYHAEQITTADGKVLQDSQVEALVTAMAPYAPPALGQLTLPADYWTALSAVITGSWH
jgi:Ca2+-binding RTX toxin-like protein